MSKPQFTDWRPPRIDSAPAVPWEDTELYNRWARRVKDGKPNDMLIVISASSYTGVSGTGKTTAATSIAEEFDLGEFDAEERATMDPSKFAYDILVNSEPGSAMILEEAQGTPASTGLNKRRGMKEESMAAINGILANRDNNYTIIIVVQQLSMLDVSLIPLIDAWLLIQKEPSDPAGPEMTHHEVHGQDYRLKSQELKTPAVEELAWPAIPHDNENYQAIERKKQEAKQRDGHDDEENETPFQRDDIPTKVRNDIIKSTYENSDVTQEELAEVWDITRQRVQQVL